MSGDSLEVTIQGANKDFTGPIMGNEPETLIVVTDTKGQYRNQLHRRYRGRQRDPHGQGPGSPDRGHRAVHHRQPGMLTPNKSSIARRRRGPGHHHRPTLTDGNGTAMNNMELRWTTTFGTFTPRLSRPPTATASPASPCAPPRDRAWPS